MDLSKVDLEIKHHVFKRALDRGIHPDLIEETILKGKVERFGKHGVRFVRKGQKRHLICIGELIGTTLKIFTIEEGNTS